MQTSQISVFFLLVLRDVRRAVTRNQARTIYAVTIFVIALALAGTLDYQDAKMQERVMCSHQPKPEFCQ
ncbi:MAG: hypothetical protein JWM78_1636 [Verrucomicrobiaceae bacterium]|nr:hypothetical protein [Verrucomicrobiaceae bacterium]